MRVYVRCRQQHDKDHSGRLRSRYRAAARTTYSSSTSAPVWKDWEGDGGDTFVTGGRPQIWAGVHAMPRALFHSVRRSGRIRLSAGYELYDFAASQAQALGWELIWTSRTSARGFPHAMAYDGPMASVPFRPSRSCGCGKYISGTPSAGSARSLRTCVG